jgi:hypothetical protein
MKLLSMKSSHRCLSLSLTMPRLLLVIVALFSMGMCRVQTAAGAEYDVAAVKPELVVDAQTTLLMDFSEPGRQAVRHSSAGWSPTGGDATLEPGEGLAATMQIPRQGHFDPARFTLEAVIKVKPTATNQTLIADWSAPRQYTARLRVDGVQLGIKGLNANAGLSQNGHSMANDAPDQWVYVAIGVDLEAGRLAAVVRGMDGRLLRERMEFIAQAGVLGDVDLSAAAALSGENETSLERLTVWKQAAQAVEQLTSLGEPAALSLGGEQVVVKQLRLSSAFRSDILLPHARPWQTRGTILSAQAIDPARAQAVMVTRTVGVDRYNQRVLRVQETQLPLTPGGEAVRVQLPELAAGAYVIHLYGQVEPKGRDKLERIWLPCPIEFAARDAQGRLIASGRRLAKQGFVLQRLQGFELHTLEPGPVTLSFSLPAQARESLRLVYVNVIDRLADLPDEAIKTRQNLDASETVGRQLSELSAERMRRDDEIWASLPPLNGHLQVHNALPSFAKAPAGAAMASYAMASTGTWDGKAFHPIRALATPQCTFKPLDLINTQTGEIFPHAKVVAGEPWPGDRPDDGTGVFLSRKEFPALPHDVYYSPRAILLGQRVQTYLGLLGVWDYRNASLPALYARTGDPQAGHDAALALARLAWDWPLLEMNLHELRVSTHSPDLEFNTDWSQTRNGKYFYQGWSGSHAVELMQAYDQVFPYIQNNQVFADALRRFIPWVATPQDVVRFFDRYLVFASVQDHRDGLLRAAPVEDLAGQVLGPHPLTVPLFDLTRQHAVIYPYEGVYQDLYATALSRSGSYHIGSFMVYGYGDATQTIRRAFLARQIKTQGVPLPMDLSDLNRYRKVRAAGAFLLDMWVAGGFPFMIGDASGGTHTGPKAAWQRIAATAQTHQQMFELDSSPRHAWVLKRLGSSDPAILKAADGQRDPILHNPSRVVPDWGAVLEMNPDVEDLTRRAAATLRLGIGQGHAHSDYLDLNLFALGLPIAVDLACRSEGANWSRPKSSLAFLHNHAIAHDTDDPADAGGQNGEPWLDAYAPPVIRSRYTEGDGSSQLDRDIVMMPVGDPADGVGYVFDLQRLRGRKLHTWCFHGCESEDVTLNTAMTDQTVRWVDRTLKPHRTGQAPAALEAIWTMTRQARPIAHDFNGGGVVKTMACEPLVLGDRYDASLPPVRVRATLLQQQGATVMRGSPFSQAYQYAFPFLWVQKAASGESVFPAVYDWYRGDQPTVTRFEQVAGKPNVFEVATRGGQVDTFTCSDQGLAVVSRDEQGVRWAKLVGVREWSVDGLALRADKTEHRASVVEIDYDAGLLTLSEPLPSDTYALIGNAHRTSYLFLRGSGVSRRFDDDLLMHQSTVRKLAITSGDTISLETELAVFRADAGNRRLPGLTVTSEDHRWQFRDGKVIRRPAGEALAAGAFLDADGNGREQVKTYELGIGDDVRLPADIELRRRGASWQVKTNVALTLSWARGDRRFDPAIGWQDW